MLLGKVMINTNGTLEKQSAREMSRTICRKLGDLNKTNMLAFYPSICNLDSIELVMEIIGNYHIRRGPNTRINFDQIARMLYSQIRKAFPKFPINDVAIEEISFCQASSAMIYCYKQDDYLIPDSDPHDVLCGENLYNSAKFTYFGRFLPMIKCWSDLAQYTPKLFTSDVLSKPEYSEFPSRKVLEFQAFSEDNVEREVNNLSMIRAAGLGGFRAFNKFYKILVSDRTMIPITIAPIVKQLYLNHQLDSQAIYTIDIVDILEAQEQDENFFVKLESVFNELKGATLIAFVDIPNHFLKTQEVYTNEVTDTLQKHTTSRDDDELNIDQDFNSNMQEYDLLDIDDSLDFPLKPLIMREVVSSIYKAKEEKEGDNAYLNLIEKINNIVFKSIRTMNVVLAYTDTLAFDSNYIFSNLVKLCKELSIKKVDLSSSDLTNDRLTDFGTSIGFLHFDVDKISDNKEQAEDIRSKVNTIVSERTNSDPEKSYAYSSLYGFRYLVNHSFDYRFAPDVEGDEYFKKFKEEREKEMAKLDEVSEEEKATIIKKFSTDYGTINHRAVIDASDDDDIDFFGHSNHKKKDFNGDKQKDIPLDKMIGLTSIKEQIEDFSAFVQINKTKIDKGLKEIPISKHMVFMGNPGTAKSTVALQLAKILHDKGLIPTADIKHVSRDDLVGKYVGWTAKLVKEAIDKAKGGILFIDEAYSLTATEGGNNSYGIEAINTFVNYMDKADVRDSTIFIFAGYKEEMKNFIKANPGLKSRIGFYFDFPDYTPEELIEIAKVQAANAEYQLENGYLVKLKEYLQTCYGKKDFGNGRLVRNILEKSIIQQSKRLFQQNPNKSSYSKSDLITIKTEDFSVKGIVDLDKDTKSVGFVKG